MDEFTETERVPISERAARFLERLERVYLKILRGFILVFATLLIFYAGWLAITSTFKIMRSSDSVVEASATVNGEDLLPAEGAERARQATSPEGEQINPEHRRFYQQFARRYHALFQQRFEPFRQSEDRQLSLTAFDDTYLETENRLQAIGAGTLSFDSDREDLELLLTAMSDAAANPTTQRRLQTYKNAQKVRVCRDIQRQRTVYRDGWDRYSTACRDWFYPPYGCPVRRAVQEPYSERVCEMQFPEGTRSHADIFRAYHDRFFELLNNRREENAARAANQRADIIAGNLEGELSLMEAARIFGGFLVIMFFFLLIAIERHQRRLAKAIGDENEGSSTDVAG